MLRLDNPGASAWPDLGRSCHKGTAASWKPPPPRAEGPEVRLNLSGSKMYALMGGPGAVIKRLSLRIGIIVGVITGIYINIHVFTIYYL